MTKNNIIKALLLVAFFSAAIVSCDDREESTSVITTFENVDVTTSDSPQAASEAAEDTITFTFFLSDAQVNDVNVEVHVGPSSTATEGEDFELSTHELEIPAFGGQDGFTIDVYVHEDFEAEAGEPETIYLTFTTTDPSGVKSSEVLVGTITDSGVTPEPAPAIEITAAWADVDLPFGDGFDGCDIADIDIYIFDAALENEMTGFAGASASCPEHFELDLSGEANGTYYVIADLWDLAYADFGEFGPVELPITTTFERGMTAGDEVNMLEIAQTQEIITTDSPVGAPTGFVTYAFLAEIHYADGVYTIVDQDGNETAMRQNTSRIKEAILKARKGAGRGQ